MNPQVSKKISIAIGVASVAASAGNIAAQAGPALQSLNNLTNTAEFTITNTYGQSFSADGIMNANVTPFATGAAAGMAGFTGGTALLTTNFNGFAFSSAAAVGLTTFNAVTAIQASVEAAALVVPLQLNAAGIGAIELSGAATTQTIGASISSTVYGPSSLKATSSYTNQLINDLSAF
jgi:hypothetical protein